MHIFLEDTNSNNLPGMTSSLNASALFYYRLILYQATEARSAFGINRSSDGE